jgi:hypothetical protein
MKRRILFWPLLVCATATTSIGAANVALAQPLSNATASTTVPTVAAVASTSATAASPTATTTAQTADVASPTWSTCKENVPEGKTRPTFEEKFPAQVPGGHAAVLEVTLTHGKGERVLADAFELQRDSDGAKALRQAGFEFPSTSGPGAPRVERTERESDAVTLVKLTVVPLPKEPGPHPSTLPPLPIAVARASGEVITLCTSPHDVMVTDPTASVPNAEPKRHPGGERQRELWVALRNVTYGALLGLALAALIALVVRWYKRRPKVLPPPPPPRPAWELALQALADLRHSDLLSRGQFTSHLERVNHVLRQYLGGRYGFDGLESTTEEVLLALKASSLPTSMFAQTEHMLRDSDLVKFAKLVPTEAQCTMALEDVEGLVRKTMHNAESVNLEEQVQATAGVSQPIRGGVTSPAAVAHSPGPQSASVAPTTSLEAPTSSPDASSDASTKEGSS